MMSQAEATSCGCRADGARRVLRPRARRARAVCFLERAEITVHLRHRGRMKKVDCRMKPRRYTMFAGLDSFFVQLPDLVRTTTFRWTASAFAVCIVLFSAFVYWEAADYMSAKTDAALTEESLAIAADSPDRQLDAIEDRLRQDPRRIRLAGLFGRDSHRIAGNLKSLPPGLRIDAPVQSAVAIRLDPNGPEETTVRAIASSLPDGNVLVIARNIDELKQLAEVVARALMLGLPFALGLGLAISMVLSIRAQKRVVEFNTLVHRIVGGD